MSVLLKLNAVAEGDIFLNLDHISVVRVVGKNYELSLISGDKYIVTPVDELRTLIGEDLERAEIQGSFARSMRGK